MCQEKVKKCGGIICGNCSAKMQAAELERKDRAAAAEKIDAAFVGFVPRFLDVKHTFLDGVYTRSGVIAAGVVGIGAVHRKRNIFHIHAGSCLLWDNFNGVRKLTAPHTEISEPGIQRVIIALERVEGCNILETEETTVEGVEKELFEPFSLPNSIGDKILSLCNAGEIKSIQI